MELINQDSYFFLLIFKSPKNYTEF